MKSRLLFAALAFLAMVAGIAHPPSTSTSKVTTAAAFIAPRRSLLEVNTVIDPTTTTTTTEPTTTTTAPPPPPTTEHPATAPAPAGEVAPPPEGSVADAVRQWFPDNFDSAWGVSGCESGHNPGAVSPGGGNWGLFQINTVHRDDFEAVTGVSWNDGILNAYYNSQYARKLYEGSGWGPWTCKWAA